MTSSSFAAIPCASSLEFCSPPCRPLCTALQQSSRPFRTALQFPLSCMMSLPEPPRPQTRVACPPLSEAHIRRVFLALPSPSFHGLYAPRFPCCSISGSLTSLLGSSRDMMHAASSYSEAPTQGRELTWWRCSTISLLRGRFVASSTDECKLALPKFDNFKRTKKKTKTKENNSIKRIQKDENHRKSKKE